MAPESVPSSIEVWRSITQTPDLVEYFRGLFDRISFTVAETGEAFTATHHGDALTFSEGVDAAADFTVPLQWRTSSASPRTPEPGGSMPGSRGGSRQCSSRR